MSADPISQSLPNRDDPDRIGPVTVLGLDETAFVRTGEFRQRLWSTQLVGDGQLLDVPAGAVERIGDQHRTILDPDGGAASA